MVRVAIAGGSGGLGKTIVEALSKQGGYEIVILTRERTPSKPFVTANYSSVDSVAELLERHRIHTVVSTIVIKSHEQREAQLNLIRGAARTSTVQRLTPSEFGVPRDGRTLANLSDVGLATADHKTAAIIELEKTHLEYTLFSHGCFMDYYGIPQIPSNLSPWTFAVDVAHNCAGIPGSGNVPIVWTYSHDVARFVVATLSLPEGSWQKQSIVIGDEVSFNDIVRIAEQVLGRKFTVSYDSLEKLQKGEITELPSHKKAYGDDEFGRAAFLRGFAGFGIAIETGVFEFRVPDGVRSLNTLFPATRPFTMEEMLKKAWTTVQS